MLRDPAGVDTLLADPAVREALLDGQRRRLGSDRRDLDTEARDDYSRMHSTSDEMDAGLRATNQTLKAHSLLEAVLRYVAEGRRAKKWTGEIAATLDDIDDIIGWIRSAIETGGSKGFADEVEAFLAEAAGGGR